MEWTDDRRLDGELSSHVLTSTSSPMPFSDSSESPCPVRSRGAVGLLALMALLCCLPNIIWHVYPAKDTAFFYSRMIHELAAGNWQGGFFPFIPPLFMIVGAPIAFITRLDGFAVAKITSALFFALTIFPLHRLLTRIFGRPAALWGGFLYICCPRIVRYGGSGLLDTGKVFFLVAVACLTFELFRKQTPGRSILFGAACGGLALIKGEGIVLSALFLGGFHIAQCRGRKLLRWLLPSRQLVIAFVSMIAVIFPWVVYVNWQTGYPFTDGRQSWVLNRVLERVGAGMERDGALPEEPPELHPFLPENWRDTVAVEGWTDRNIFDDAVMRVIKGFYPLYWPLVIWGLVLRRREFRWRGGDGYLLLVMFVHTFFLLAVTGFQWTEKRYVIAAMPFMLGWAGLGLAGFFRWAGGTGGNARRLFVVRAGCILLLVSGIISGNSKAYRDQRALQSDPEVRAAMAVADWFANHRFDVPDKPRVYSTRYQFHNGRRPLIAAFDQRQIYFAGGDGLFLPIYGAGLTVEQLALICGIKGVDLLIWTDLLEGEDQGFSMFNFYPNLRGFDRHPRFTLVERIEREKSNTVEIYSFH